MSDPTAPLRISEARCCADDNDRTGIYVRAQLSSGKWINADIYQLERDSLHRWLRSRGGKNLWAENCVLSLLGHEQYESEPEFCIHGLLIQADCRECDEMEKANG